MVGPGPESGPWSWSASLLRLPQMKGWSDQTVVRPRWVVALAQTLLQGFIAGGTKPNCCNLIPALLLFVGEAHSMDRTHATAQCLPRAKMATVSLIEFQVILDIRQ